jgi:serine/threonine-protein kinase
MTNPHSPKQTAIKTSQRSQVDGDGLPVLLSDRYKPINLINENIFYTTYLAEDQKDLNKPKLCLLKKLNIPDQSQNSLSLIFNLINKRIITLRQITEDEHFPNLLDFFQDQQQLYVVQEYIEGQTLQQKLTEQGPWQEAEAVDVLNEVLIALNNIHNHGLIYQCLQPTNIIYRQGDDNLVLVGLGFIQNKIDQLIRSQKNTKERPLSPDSPYLAPEQLLGKAQFNSDIYALGVVVIEGLTGIKPDQLTIAIQQGHWQQSCRISASLTRLIEGMVQTNTQQRYQLAGEILQDLNSSDQKPKQSASIVPIPAQLETSAVTDATIANTNTKINDTSSNKNFDQEEPQEETINHGRSSRKWSYWAGLFGLFGLAAGALFFLLTRVLPPIPMASDPEEKTIEEYNRILETNPQDGEAYFARGMIFQQQQDQVAALQDFSKAIDLGYESGPVYYYRGNARFFLGDTEGAIEDYQGALRLEPEHTEALVNLGNAYGSLGDETAAIANYTKAITIDPTIAAAYLNRCLSRTNTGDASGAVEDCSEAIKLRPAHSFAYENRGLAKWRLGDLAGAIQDFNIALAIEPASADAYYNRGLVRYELGDYQGAIMDFDQAIALNPNHPFAYYDRASIHERQGRNQEAISDFTNASRICLELARLGCHKDAQYRLQALNQPQK